MVEAAVSFLPKPNFTSTQEVHLDSAQSVACVGTAISTVPVGIDDGAGSREGQADDDALPLPVLVAFSSAAMLELELAS